MERGRSARSVPKKAKELGWYGVRCFFRWPDYNCYEERITVWRAMSFDEAIAKAEREARRYASEGSSFVYLDIAQAYHMVDRLKEGAEVFSLLRESDLGADAYIDRYFMTGAEREGAS